MRTFQSVLSRPGTMSFGAGFMNPDGFDLAGVRAAFGEALSDAEAAASLQYGLAEGSERLRAAIVSRMVALGVAAQPTEIVVTTGATQALGLLCEALLDPGDVVLVERPTYAVALQQFHLAGVRTVSVPGDAHGVDPGVLHAALREHRPKAMYTIPTFQNPGGSTLSASRRAAVARLAERHGIWVIEDDPYRELRYASEPPPDPIAAHSRAHVIYIGTLAKTVAPGLRVGWVLAPEEVVDVCRPVKQSLDLNTSSVDQAAAAVYLERVDWAVRTAALRAVYGKAMRAMLDALPGTLPDGTAWTCPGGGVFVWAELPDGWSTEVLLEHSLRHGIFFMPGQPFLADVISDRTLRLSISNHTPETVAVGMARLQAAVAEVRPRAAMTRV
ncbi:MAG: aminotransferase-like domain-containing protein [Solirubrobacteraceae bacterium]